MMTTPLPPETAPAGFQIVYFELDDTHIRPEIAATLRKHAGRLIEAHRPAVVEGHGDERGPADCNLALGQRRALAVRDALVADGVPAGRLQWSALERSGPWPRHTEESWSKNRRAVTAYRNP